MQVFVHVGGFVFHTQAGFIVWIFEIVGLAVDREKDVSMWLAHMKWKEASSPGSYVFVVHQLSRALEIFWICFFCSEQMASLCSDPLLCMHDVSRIPYTCNVLELHVHMLMIYLGFLDIQRSQARAQTWALLSGREDGGKTSSCFSLLGNLPDHFSTKSDGSRAPLEVGIS